MNPVWGLEGFMSRNVRGLVTKVEWLSPTVLSVIFRPFVALDYRAGQFLNLVVPTTEKGVRRYSVFLARGPELAKRHGHEIWIKEHVDSPEVFRYLANARPGTVLHFEGPQGDFQFHPPTTERDIVFAVTSVGLAPVRAIIQSETFRHKPPRRIFLLSGVRHESEVLFRSELEKLGVNVIPCVGRPTELRAGFWGSIRSLLERDVLSLDRQNTDFYLAGSSEMVEEIETFLKENWEIGQAAITTQATDRPLTGGVTHSLKLIPLSFHDEIPGKKAA